jgi:hypothetical protein
MFAKHAANTAVERVMHTGFIQRLGLQADQLLDGEDVPPRHRHAAEGATSWP